MAILGDIDPESGVILEIQPQGIGGVGFAVDQFDLGAAPQR